MKEKSKVENISCLIALGYILDDFEEFDNRLAKLISVKDNANIVRNLVKISNGEFILGSKKVKKFYEENKKVIDEFKKHSSLSNFIIGRYDWTGNKRKDSCLDFFYKYFIEHKDNISSILRVLEKLKNIGCTKLQFDESIDFTSEEYRFDECANYCNFEAAYLDNMEVISNYKYGIIKYKTTGSNYKLFLKNSFTYFWFDMAIVNSLLFDPQRLPESLDKNDVYNKILSLAKEKEEERNNVTSSVDLFVNISDINEQFKYISETVEKIDDVKFRSELKDLLLSMKQNIEKLEMISAEYDESIVENSSLTKQGLEEEKTLYLKRREASKYDYD